MVHLKQCSKVNSYTLVSAIYSDSNYNIYGGLDSQGNGVILKMVDKQKYSGAEDSEELCIDQFDTASHVFLVYGKHAFEEEGSDYFTYDFSNSDSDSDITQDIDERKKEQHIKSILHRIDVDSHVEFARSSKQEKFGREHAQKLNSAGPVNLFPRTPIPRGVSSTFISEEALESANSSNLKSTGASQNSEHNDKCGCNYRKNGTVTNYNDGKGKIHAQHSLESASIKPASILSKTSLQQQTTCTDETSVHDVLITFSQNSIGSSSNESSKLEKVHKKIPRTPVPKGVLAVEDKLDGINDSDGSDSSSSFSDQDASDFYESDDEDEDDDEGNDGDDDEDEDNDSGDNNGDDESEDDSQDCDEEEEEEEEDIESDALDGKEYPATKFLSPSVFLSEIPHRKPLEQSFYPHHTTTPEKGLQRPTAVETVCGVKKFLLPRTPMPHIRRKSTGTNLKTVAKSDKDNDNYNHDLTPSRSRSLSSSTCRTEFELSLNHSAMLARRKSKKCVPAQKLSE